MKRSPIFALALGLAVALSAQDASAQKHGNKGKGKDRDNDRGVVVQQSSGGGPKFCQNGQGHPVHGRQWCVDHGFGLGAQSVVRRSRTGVVWLTQPQFVSLLSPGQWAQLERQARQRGYTGPYRGRQYYDNGLRVVTLRAGDVGIAEIVLDPNGHLVRSYFLR
jgi:hypothetical protein